MSIVFDEVIGTILPEPSPTQADPEPSLPEPPSERPRDRQRRIDKRAARLQAN